ncbi:trimethylamine-corrinoid protein Co-methyltransferase [Acididesulfobacillus acetoxydans]|uniref:Trimethylamine methyltransferase MttB n=1 Tax=Acididesulfobacillus acetoxydans TaxID=1561005 RepID=A0A8S0VWA2_9FIRM|nr:trimethylamine methyltransferase family protein [Acididesulfobacillus acetoxydans]CAA7600613.1 trimethylamine-corrinoid protein Co-methyltransferase [Acididesulfobacillus acetoxydans]CEJ09394.1 Trimethylamine methyltransferase MttB [Acididesulfobacillus acetoxydans]
MTKSQYVRANYQVNATPQFHVLSEHQCENIYYGALEALERTGAEVHSRTALEIFRQGGCRVDGNRVRFPTRLVERAVSSTPSRVVISDRHGHRSMFLEGSNVYYGPGPTNTYTLDPFTGERRRPKKSDTVRAGIVCDALPNIAYAMDNGTPMDVTPTLADVHAFQALLENTVKPIIHWGFGIEQYQDIVEMAAAVAGGLAELQRNPFIVLYSESSPPLRHSEEAIDKAIFAAKTDIPVIYTPCTFAGGVAPATMAGSLVISVADFLVGLVAGQLVREGASFIMGGLISTMDMSSSILSYGATELSLLSAGLTDVARHMKIPMFSTGGCSDSKVIDVQTGIEAAFSILIAGLSGASIVHDCNYMEYGATGSLELMVMDDEIIGMVKRILEGIEVDDEHLAVDVIDAVGPGGHFLGEMHTMAHFRDFWAPTLINRLRYDGWKAEGSKTMGQRIREKTQNIINTHKPEKLPDEVLRQIQTVVDRAEAREAAKKISK